MRTAIRVGTIEARRGEVARGFLHVGELADGCTPVRVPVVVVNGADDGPVAYLHAGSHGQETIYAVELFRRLVGERLDPALVRGAVIIVPAANLLAHHAASRIAPHYGVREGGAFGGDLHKLWPGDPAGSITQRVAAVIWAEIVAQADLVVDYHTNSSPGLPFTLLYRPDDGAGSRRDEDAWRRTLALARAFGLTVVQGAPTPNALSGASLQAGTPALMVEIPSPRVLDAGLVGVALLGTENLLAHAGIVEGPVRTQTGAPVLAGEHVILPSIRANRGGVLRCEAVPGAFCAAGSVIARLYDVFGDEVETVRMAADGYVSTYPALSWAGAQAIASGDYVADCFS